MQVQPVDVNMVYLVVYNIFTLRSMQVLAGTWLITARHIAEVQFDKLKMTDFQ
jgi:hypothetical protein